MRLIRATVRPWPRFIVVLALGGLCDAHGSEHIPVVDDPYGYIAFDQDVKDALALFAAERGIAVDVAPDVRGRLKGRVEVASGRELLNNAAQASRAIWHYDGRRLLVRRASISGTRRIAAGHLTDSRRQALLRHLHQAGLGAGLSYDALTGDFIAQGPPEFIDAVAHAVPLPLRRTGTAIEVHRFGKR